VDDILITIDEDWAPDFAVSHVAGALTTAGVRSTWFVTHESPALDFLRSRPDLFQLGIHPNFRPGSTHGTASEEVLAHCLRMIPEARAIRTHGLVQSSDLLDLVTEGGAIEIDSSLYVPWRDTPPFDHYSRGRRLLRVPFMFEDDLEMRRPLPDWTVQALRALPGGCAVLNFHPVHVFLNSSDMSSYGRLRARFPILSEAQEDVARRLVQPGVGTATMFAAVTQHLQTTGASQFIGDLRSEQTAGDGAR
jgi:hypothetical protein